MPHTLQCRHTLGVVVEHGSRSVDDLSLKLHDSCLHYVWVNNHDVPVAGFLPRNALCRCSKRCKVIDIYMPKAGATAGARKRQQ